MTSFHFSLGNSTDGPVGFCARVTAGNETEALEYLKLALARDGHNVMSNVETDGQGGEIEYLEVYFNPDVITLADIDEVDG